MKKYVGSCWLVLVQFLKFTNQYFFSSNRMYFLYSTNLIRKYKTQPLLFALGGGLEEKNRPNHIEK